MLQPSEHLLALFWTCSIHVLLMLRAPELDVGLQVGSHESGVRGRIPSLTLLYSFALTLPGSSSRPMWMLPQMAEQLFQPLSGIPAASPILGGAG